MKILKSTEYSYLKGNYSKYGIVGLIALLIGIALLITGINIYKTNPYILVFSFPALGIGINFLRKSRNYDSGIKGEKAVTERLKELDDSYYLINDVTGITDGNIDHILLSTKGIFVIESKNYSGEIRCYGDRWFRKGNRKSYELRSISNQAKSNALAVSNYIYRKITAECLLYLYVCLLIKM